MAFLFTGYSNAQELTSPDVLVPGGWTGVVPGAAGGTSGGYTPGYNSITDTIIFGYTQATVSRSIGIQAALEAAGVGLRVAGYKYSWLINNADMNTGTLSANVSLLSRGTTLESYWYNYNARTSGLAENFQLFSGTELFKSPYTVQQADTLTVSFTGKDDRYWAGFWGPRVRAPDLYLLYAPSEPEPIDPCKLVPQNCVTQEAVAQPVAAMPETTETTQPAEVVVVSSPTQPTASAAATSTSATTTSTAAIQTVTKPGASIGLVLNILRGEQSRVSSTEKQAVTQAVESAQKALEQVSEAAVATATSAAAQSISFSGGVSSASIIQSASTIQTATQQTVQVNTAGAATSTYVGGYTEQAPLATAQYRAGEFSAVVYVPDVVEPALDQREFTINKSAVTNPALGAVDINQLVAGSSLLDYTKIILADVKFYASKPLYQNQRVVDNKQVLRKLASDQVHEQMVQQQYQK